MMPLKTPRFFKAFFVIMTFGFTIMTAHALAQSKKTEIENSFTFDARTATPMRGVPHDLRPDYYFLQLVHDTLICALPYFGRIYTVPAPEEMIHGGYQFTTTHYSMTTDSMAKRREITFSVKPYRDELKITLDISKSGWTEVLIESSGREAISYYGELSTD